MAGESQHLEYIGVYNADASVWSEVSYWFWACLGVRHCSLVALSDAQTGA